MRCCLIGGAGLIGTQVAKSLVESGREVVVFGRASKPRHELPEMVRYLSEDRGNPLQLREIISGVEQVIDFAYSTVPKTSFENPVFDILSNLPRSVELFQEAVTSNIQKLVVVSSGGTVYGRANSTPIAEDHPTHPISPYGITKLTIEKYAKMYAVIDNLPVVVVRPGNAYGEEQIVSKGQGFIATAIQSILMRRKVDVFGSHGTIRDYLHVSDIARGIIGALDLGQPSEIYNIGSGIGHNNLEVLSVIKPFAEQAGYTINVNLLPHREFDVPVNILDSNKLKSMAGWEPQVSFEDGLKWTWDAALKKLS